MKTRDFILSIDEPFTLTELMLKYEKIGGTETNKVFFLVNSLLSEGELFYDEIYLTNKETRGFAFYNKKYLKKLEIINSIKKYILEYDDTFLIKEMLGKLNYLGYDEKISLEVIDELYKTNKIIYKKFLPEYLGDEGYAYASINYFNKVFYKFINKRLSDLKIEDEETRDKVLKLIYELKEINSDQKVPEKTR